MSAVLSVLIKRLYRIGGSFAENRFSFQWYFCVENGIVLWAGIRLGICVAGIAGVGIYRYVSRLRFRHVFMIDVT